MQFENTPSTSLTVPLNAGPGTSRRVIGPFIPAVLVNFTPDYQWFMADLFYFQGASNEFVFTGLVFNTVFGIAQQVEGVYTVASGVQLVRIIEGAGGTVPSVKWGSELYNTMRLAFNWRGTDVLLSDASTFSAENPITQDSTPDVWHTLTLAAGWTGFFEVKKLPGKRVDVLAVMTPGAPKADGTTILTLPGPYKPLANCDLQASANVTVAGGQAPHFGITAGTGAVACWGFGSATYASCTATYPLT